uniref:Uncharacterized protein n=1 Tax=Myotis myotis TaxID=51298 RepID=A0A7J7VIY0_MYOMY|nr:hypothetical protein mMyoMyo1_008396 [Myotis myotis]
MCPTPRPPCAALLTLPCDPWAPVSSAEMPLTPLDYLICSRLSPHPVGLSHLPLISFLESSVCLSHPPAWSPSSLRIKSMTHSSWGRWGSLVGVRDSPLPCVSSSIASVEPLSSQALSQLASKANPAPSDRLFDFLTCGLFPAGPGPAHILFRLDPPHPPSPDPYSLAPMMLRGLSQGPSPTPGCCPTWEPTGAAATDVCFL